MATTRSTDVRKALIVGCGSIGQRHIRNLNVIGVSRLLAFDPSPERLEHVRQAHGVSACKSLSEGLAHQPDAVFVCTPPHLHTPVAFQAVQAGIHVFVEKPIANELRGVDLLLAEAERQGVVLMVGFNLRFHPGLIQLKKLVEHEEAGRIIGIRAEFGQYLADWRPRDDYRKGYFAREETGGGIILEESHELDYVRWIAGEVQSVSAVAEHLSDLEIETEDTAVITLRLASGAVAQVHVDCVQRGYWRNCKVIGSDGVLTWDARRGVQVYGEDGGLRRDFPIQFDANQAFVDELQHFIACVRGSARPPVDGREGKRVLVVALTAKESARLRREITV